MEYGISEADDKGYYEDSVDGRLSWEPPVDRLARAFAISSLNLREF